MTTDTKIDRSTMDSKDYKDVDEPFEYISPPPEKHAAIRAVDGRDFKDVIKTMLPGRLSVTCIEAKNLRRKDRNKDKSLLNPYIQLTLGKKVLSSKKQRCVSHSPSFNDEVVSFDIQNPMDIVSFETEDIKLNIEVIDTSPLENTSIGKVNISVMRFFLGLKQSEWIPLYQQEDTSSNSSIHLHFQYFPVREGILQLSTLNISNIDKFQTPADSSDMQIVFSIGDFKRQSQLVLDRPRTLSFHPSIVKEYLDLNHNNWFQPLHTKLISGLTNNIIFEQSLVLIEFMSQTEDATPKYIELPLNELNHLSTGCVTFELKFFQSSSMDITIEKAKSLVELDASGQGLNPYVVIKSEGRSSCPQYRSRTINDGGLHPIWNEDVKFTITDHCQLQVECYNENRLLSNTHSLIGTGSLSLMSAYRTGHSSSWINLTRTNEVGAILQTGQIKIVTKFEDVGSKFPRFHQSNTSMQLKSSEVQKLDYVVSASAAQGLIREMREKGDTGEEYTDDDIRSTFSLLDLDRNGYVGSAELRHVLINMGELITDEEVDTMISMLDKNGDGQVNFSQFSAMAKCSDAHNMESCLDISLQSPTSRDTSKSDHNEKERQKLFSEFIKLNNIGQKNVQNLTTFFIRKHRNFVSNKHSDVNTEDYKSVTNIDFLKFTELLPIQTTGESQNVFDMMDYGGDGIDVRVLILSLCSFLGTYSVDEKCSLIFDLFDGAEKGVDIKYMNIILAGTHLKCQDDVNRKAQTIVSFFLKNSGSSLLSMDQLQTAALKFPNLFLPKLA